MLKKSWTLGTLNVTDVPELNICKWLQWWILCSFSDQNLLPSKPKIVLDKNHTVQSQMAPFKRKDGLETLLAG